MGITYINVLDPFILQVESCCTERAEEPAPGCRAGFRQGAPVSEPTLLTTGCTASQWTDGELVSGNACPSHIHTVYEDALSYIVGHG